MRQWRVITHPFLAGYENMAIDEAILHGVSSGKQPPTLRLYGWSPFCLSLGYGQATSDADSERLHAHGWGIVRRPTGGKAILHGDELTYSVALPIDHELAQGDVVSSYRRISTALMHALEQLGIAPQSEQQAKGNKGLGAVCFEVPSHYEITVYGRKLIGSAQVRRKAGILQHGTLPLWGDIARICDALAYPNEADRATAKTHVRERAITLSEVLGDNTPNIEVVAEAMVAGFAQAFDLTFTHQDISPDEEAHALQLMRDTYANNAWTYKR